MLPVATNITSALTIATVTSTGAKNNSESRTRVSGSHSTKTKHGASNVRLSTNSGNNNNNTLDNGTATITVSTTTSNILPTIKDATGNIVPPQGAEIKIPAIGATPVAVSTKLPAAVQQLTQQGKCLKLVNLDKST